MSRRLPIVGQQSVAATSTIVSTVFVDSTPMISVVGARADVGADRFVAQLVSAVEHAAGDCRVERSNDVVAGARLLVILGSHVPRSLRDPAVHGLWHRADLLLSEPSEIVAQALIASA